MQGLTTEDGDTIKGCFQKFIDLVIVYHDTAQIPCTTDKPQIEKGESSWTAEQRNPQGSDGLVVRDGQEGQDLNRLGVRMDHMKITRTRMMIHGTIKGK